ncbi:unannotated protein [freshwater metagenome]|uniref:Unannotated protein n=1 Tax=freshwater metagenome TaxID=449393 RepID=A0A6J7AXB4_9ZZZZ
MGCKAPRIDVITIFGGFLELIWCNAFIRVVTVSLLGLSRSWGKVSHAGKLLTTSPRYERISSANSSAIRVDGAITRSGAWLLNFEITNDRSELMQTNSPPSIGDSIGISRKAGRSVI